MKKLVSLFLAVLMAFSAVAVSFPVSAAKAQATLDENNVGVEVPYFSGIAYYNEVSGRLNNQWYMFDEPAQISGVENENVEKTSARALLIDGVVNEDEWGIPMLELSSDYAAKAGDLSVSGENTYYWHGVDGTNQLSVKYGLNYKLWMAWDEEYLYVAADITDPDGQLLSDGGINVWNGDCLEIRVDPDGPNSKVGGIGYDPSVDPWPWATTERGGWGETYGGKVMNLGIGYLSSGEMEVYDMSPRYAPYMEEILDPETALPTKVLSWNQSASYWNRNYEDSFEYDESRPTLDRNPFGSTYAASWLTMQTSNENNNRKQMNTQLEVAIPWTYMNGSYVDYTEVVGSDGEITIDYETVLTNVIPQAGDEYGLAIALLNGGRGGNGYNSWLTWGSGVCAGQFEKDYMTAGGSNSMVLVADELGTTGCVHTFAEATCEAPETCTACGYERGFATGHEYSHELVAAPTSVADGKIISTCTAGCNAVIKTVLPAAKTEPKYVFDGSSSINSSIWSDGFRYLYYEDEEMTIPTIDPSTGLQKDAIEYDENGELYFDFTTTDTGTYYATNKNFKEFAYSYDIALTGENITEYYEVNPAQEVNEGYLDGIYHVFGGTTYNPGGKSYGTHYAAGFFPEEPGSTKGTFRIYDEAKTSVTDFGDAVIMAESETIDLGTEWHNFVLSFDEDTDTAIFYLDGEAILGVWDPDLDMAGNDQVLIMRNFEVSCKMKNMQIGDSDAFNSVHDYAAEVSAPTCMEGGYTIYTCIICGDFYKTDYVDALGHAWNQVEVDGECGSIAQINYECVNCGETKVEDGAIIDHDYLEIVTLEPTCTVPGNKHIICTRCDFEDDEEIVALGHIEGSSRTETINETQYDVVRCTRCSAILKRTAVNINFDYDPDGDGEYFVLKASDATISKDATTVDVNIDILENTGIYAMKYYVIYDKELTLVSNDNVTDGDAFLDFLVSDVMSKDIPPEEMSVLDIDWDWQLDNYFCDYGWTLENPDDVLVTTVFSECVNWYDSSTDVGTICTFTFQIAPDNTKDELTVQILPVYGNYIRDDPDHPLADPDGIVEIFDPQGLPGTITITEGEGGDTPPAPPVFTEPTIWVSDATVNEGDATADFTVNVANNTGVYSILGYIGYDEAMSIEAFTIGEVFAEAEFPLGNPLELPAQHDIAATNKNVQKAYAAHGASAEGKLSTMIQAEGQSIVKNNTNNGVLATFTLNTANLPVGVYDIVFYYSPDSTCNVDFENISFELVHGKLVVEGYECPHEYRAEVTAPTCTDKGFTTYTCFACGDSFVADFVDIFDHDVKVWDKIYNGETLEISGVCYNCGEFVVKGEPSENTPQFWMSNGVINKDGKVTLTLNVANNPGFWSTRIGIIYPECLKLSDASNIVGLYKDNGSGDILTSFESTGLENGIRFDMTEDPQTEDSDFISFGEMLRDEGIDYSDDFGEGYHWLGALYAVNPDFENFNGDGALYEFTFDYDESLNVNGDEVFEFYVVVETLSTFALDEETLDIIDFDGIEVYNGYAKICKHPNPVEQNRIDPDCENDGYYEVYCPDCERILEAVELPALGHDIPEWIVESMPTCFEDGLATGYCVTCGENISRVLDMLTHTAGEWEIILEAGPFNTGIQIKNCIYCGNEMENEVIPMTKEDFGLREDNESRLIKGIPVGITTELFIIHYENMGMTVTVTDASGKTPRYIGTGCSVMWNGEEFTVSVKTDLNGDGSVSSRDLMKLKKYLTLADSFNKAEIASADIDESGKVNARDSLALRKLLKNG